MLRGLARVAAVRHSSSAFCLRSFATHRITPKEFYFTMGFAPSNTDSESTNFVNFLKEIQTIPENVDYTFSKLDPDQVKVLCKGVKLSDLTTLSSLVASKIVNEFDGHSFATLYQSPKDLIDLYKHIGVSAFSYNISYSQVIATKAALTEVFSAIKDQVTDGAYTDKEYFIKSFGINNIKTILLKEEKDKNDITPVLDWLNNHFPPRYALGEYKEPSLLDWLSGAVTPRIKICPISSSILAPLIDNFQNLMQLFKFFDDKQLMLNEFGSLVTEFITNIHDFETFSKLFNKSDNIDSFYRIFTKDKIEALLVNEIRNNPDATFFQYNKWLSETTKMKYPELGTIEAFEQFKGKAISRALGMSR